MNNDTENTLFSNTVRAMFSQLKDSTTARYFLYPDIQASVTNASTSPELNPFQQMTAMVFLAAYKQLDGMVKQEFEEMYKSVVDGAQKADVAYWKRVKSIELNRIKRTRR